MSNPLGEITRSPSIRDGLDDGPELPSQATRDRAAAKIEAEWLVTDAERINWIEKTKYLETGIGYHDHRPVVQIRFRVHGNIKQFSGRSLRAAIDEAIRAEAQMTDWQKLGCPEGMRVKRIISHVRTMGLTSEDSWQETTYSAELEPMPAPSESATPSDTEQLAVLMMISADGLTPFEFATRFSLSLEEIARMRASKPPQEK